MKTSVAALCCVAAMPWLLATAAETRSAGTASLTRAALQSAGAPEAFSQAPAGRGQTPVGPGQPAAGRGQTTEGAPPAGRGQAPGGAAQGPGGRGAGGRGAGGGRGEGRGGAPALSTELNQMDHGPFISSSVATDPVTEKGIAVKVDSASTAVMMFDTDLLRVSSAWTGGYLTWYAGRDGLAQWPSPGGPLHFTTQKKPGWTTTGSFDDPRPLPLGPLPRTWGRYNGLYLNGDRVVFSYTVGKTAVYEQPGFTTVSDRAIFTRTINVSQTSEALALRVIDLPDGFLLEHEPNYVRIRQFGLSPNRFVGVRGLPPNAKWDVDDGELVLRLPALSQPLRFELAISPSLTGQAANVTAFIPAFDTYLQSTTPVADLAAARQPGPGRWAPIETQAIIGADDGPLAVDTFTVPEDNPFKSWMRLSGLDFLSDGRAVVSSISGDVWLVSGIGATAGPLQWKRFATGLNQPLGVRVVKDRIYVTGRDQITILNDLNGDGEADFYENFNNEVIAANNFHEFTMHLETDAQGNFYFTKGTAWPAISGGIAVPHTPHNGALLKLPPDGSRLEVVAKGLRHPNGLGFGPNGEIAYADNQGNWIPTSVVHLIKPGGFYGFVPSAQTDTPPADFEKPIFWTPHAVDNSPADPIWITSPSWGPLGGQMLLTSYGQATLSLMLTETVDGQIQGGFYKLPLQFQSGLLRGRFQPDGHLYLAGLSNWQSAGARKASFHRVRHTGKPFPLPVGLHVRQNGIELEFGAPLDPTDAADPENYNVEQWNYRWIPAYGSPMYLASNPEREGQDRVTVSGVRVSDDRKTVFLEIPDIKPVMQMQIGFILKAADGTELRQTIYNTIHRVPGAAGGR